MLLQYSALLSQPKPPKWNVENLENWLHNNWHPIASDEVEFVKHLEDLISVNASAKAAVRELFDYFIVKNTGGIFRFLKKAPQGSENYWQNGKVLVSDDEKVERLVVAVMFMIGLL